MGEKSETLPCLRDIEDWQVLIDVCPRPALILSSSEEIVLANEAFGELWGERKDSFRGKFLKDLFERKAATLPVFPFQDVISRGKRERVSFPWQGAHWWADLMPLKDKEGRVRGVLVSFTNLHQLAEAICGDPKFSFLEGKKGLSGKEIEEKFEAFGLFTRGLVHDLRNLINVIEGNLSLAERVEDFSQKNRFLQKARAGLEKIKEFAERILASTTVTPSYDTCDLVRLIEEEVDLLLANSEVECVLELPANLWQPRIDSFRMTQILQNLLLNAKEALKGKGLITIKAENFYSCGCGNLNEGPYIRLIISDNGPGIDPSHLSRIFDPYFSTKKEGHGLGLAVVYAILKAHGGHIEVFSSPGNGTTFILYLPALMTETDATNLQDPDSYGSFCFVVKEKAPILVVEDEEELRELYQDVLNFLGRESRAVATLSAAVSEYQKAFYAGKPFELVLSDFYLPDGDGLRLLEELRKIDPEAKVVICTGDTDQSLWENLKKAGVQAILKKPFGLEELAQILGGHLWPPG